MMSSIAVLGGVGIVCVSGIVVSSAMKFFHTFEFDLTKKIKESKNNEIRRAVGGEEHVKRINGLSRSINRQ